MTMLAFGSEACDDSEGRCLGSSVSLRSTAEQRVRARCFTFSPLTCASVVLVWFVLVGVGTWVFVRQLPGANRVLLLLLQATDVWMTVRASSAHGMSSKKNLLEAIIRQYCCIMAKSSTLISDVIRFKAHR